MDFMKRFIHDKEQKPRRKLIRKKSIRRTPKKPKYGKRTPTKSPTLNNRNRLSHQDSIKTRRHSTRNEKQANDIYKKVYDEMKTQPPSNRAKRLGTLYKYRDSTMIKESQEIIFEEENQQEEKVEMDSLGDKFKLLSKWNEEIKGQSLDPSYAYSPPSARNTESVDSELPLEKTTDQEDHVLVSDEKSPLTVHVPKNSKEPIIEAIDDDDEDLFNDIDFDQELEDSMEYESSPKMKKEPEPSVKDTSIDTEKISLSPENIAAEKEIGPQPSIQPKKVETPVREKTSTPMNFHDHANLFQQQLQQSMESTPGSLYHSTTSAKPSHRPRSSIPKFRPTSLTPSPALRRPSTTQRDPVVVTHNPNVGLYRIKKSPIVYIKKACHKRKPFGTKEHVYDDLGFCLFCHRERKLAKNQKISKRLYPSPKRQHDISPSTTPTKSHRRRPSKMKTRSTKSKHSPSYPSTKRLLPNGKMGELDIVEIQRLHEMTAKALAAYNDQSIKKTKVLKKKKKKVKTPTKLERQEYLARSKVVPRQDRKQAMAYYKRIPFDKMVLEEYKSLGKLLSTRFYYVERLDMESDPVVGLEECLDDLSLILSQKTYKKIPFNYRRKINTVSKELKKLLQDYKQDETPSQPVDQMEEVPQLDFDAMSDLDVEDEPINEPEDIEDFGSGDSDEILDEEESLMNQYLQDNPNPATPRILKIKLHDIQHLPKSDLLSQNDTYCKLTYQSTPPQKVQTRVINATSHPSFDTTFQFNCEENSCPLLIEIYDKDIMRDDLLAMITIPPLELDTIQENHAFPLSKPSGEPLLKAVVHLSIRPLHVASPNLTPVTPVPKKKIATTKETPARPPMMDVLPTLSCFH